jgi:hypothetical protein
MTRFLIFSSTGVRRGLLAVPVPLLPSVVGGPETVTERLGRGCCIEVNRFKYRVSFRLSE